MVGSLLRHVDSQGFPQTPPLPVCVRHCTLEFMKQVLPRLDSPARPRALLVPYTTESSAQPGAVPPLRLSGLPGNRPPGLLPKLPPSNRGLCPEVSSSGASGGDGVSAEPLTGRARVGVRATCEHVTAKSSGFGKGE